MYHRRMMERWRIPVLGLIWLLGAAGSQASEERSIEVTRIDVAPVVDGEIGVQEWEGVPVQGRAFVQVEPEHGEPSPFATLIRVAQTADALHVAIEALDPDPDLLSVAATDRDGHMSGDDSLAIMLDTFTDGRTAYVFMTNAIATQMDARIADNGRNVDDQWDAEWRCAARRSDTGWSAEFEIPFASLRFRPGEDRSWGLGFIRTVPRRLETSVWSGPTEDAWRVSSFGRLHGLDLPRSSARSWQAIPYALAVVDEDAHGCFWG